MNKNFYPDEYVRSIFHIDYEKLMAKGIRNIIFDIDNTIEPYDIPLPSEKDKELLTRLKAMGFTVCLVSNNRGKRVQEFNKELRLPAISNAMKPLKRGVKKIMAKVHAKPHNTAFVGDQIFTDVWCARRVGVYSILVNPIAVRDEFSVRLKRGVEKKVIAAYCRKNNIDPSKI